MTTWIPSGPRRQRIAQAIARAGLDALVGMTAENAEYLSERPSTIATLWPLPGLVAVATNARGDTAVAAGDQEIAGYAQANARYAHPLWIEHLDLRGLAHPWRSACLPPGRLARLTARRSMTWA